MQVWVCVVRAVSQQHHPSVTHVEDLERDILRESYIEMYIYRQIYVHLGVGLRGTCRPPVAPFGRSSCR